MGYNRSPTKGPHILMKTIYVAVKYQYALKILKIIQTIVEN